MHNQIKGRARVIVNEVVRFRDRLDLMIEYASERKKIHIKNKTINILRIGFYELVMDDKVPDYAAVNSAVNIAGKELNGKGKGFVNAVLRKMIFLIDNDSNWYKSLEKKVPGILFLIGCKKGGGQTIMKVNLLIWLTISTNRHKIS